MSRLVIRFQPDPNDVLGLVEARVETPRFSGSGETWGTGEDLAAFAGDLRRYPIPAESPAVVQFGFGTLAGDDLLIGVTVRQANARGELRVDVEVADRENVADRLRTHFITHYPEVERFALRLERVARGEAEEAVLDGD